MICTAVNVRRAMSCFLITISIIHPICSCNQSFEIVLGRLGDESHNEDQRQRHPLIIKQCLQTVIYQYLDCHLLDLPDPASSPGKLVEKILRFDEK